MKTIATNANNDIFLDVSGNLAISEDDLAIANIATNKARTLYKETTLDQQAGIPYFDVVFNRFDIGLFKQFLFQELDSIKGVAGVTDFSYSTKDNVLTYQATLTLDNNREVTING